MVAIDEFGDRIADFDVFDLRDGDSDPPTFEVRWLMHVLLFDNGHYRTLNSVEQQTMFNSRHWWKPWLMHALLSGKWYSLLLDNSPSWAVDKFKIGQCCKTEFDRQTRVVVVKQAASVHGVVWNENYRTISTIKSWVLCEKSCCYATTFVVEWTRFDKNENCRTIKIDWKRTLYEKMNFALTDKESSGKLTKS